MTVATARRNRLPVNEYIARRQLQTTVTYIDGWRERALQGPGDSDTVSYILLGMAAENYPGDPATDGLAIYLKRVQLPDGRWFAVLEAKHSMGSASEFPRGPRTKARSVVPSR